MIEFHEVSKRYGPVVALRGISLVVERGDVFGYVGPNGAGERVTAAAGSRLSALSVVERLSRAGGARLLLHLRPHGSPEQAMPQILGALAAEKLTVLTGAVVLTLSLAVGGDAVQLGRPAGGVACELAGSAVVDLAGLAVACSVGVLFGVLFSSLAVSAVLAVYVGNQLTSLIVLPTILVPGLDPVLYCVLVGLLGSALLLGAAIVVFARKAGA